MVIAEPPAIEASSGYAYLDAPDELVDLPQWVAWKREMRDGRWTKVPYNPATGRHASSVDPLTWGTYDQALSAYRQGGYAGVGFVVTKDDPVVGIDLRPLC